MNRRSLLLFAALFLAMLAVIAVAVSRYEPKVPLEFCGHAKPFRFPLATYAPHHCASFQAINDLRTLHTHLQVHEIEKRTNATTFEELGEHVLPAWGRFHPVLVTEGTNWSMRVAQQNELAGHYLLTSAGRLHFNPTQPATTNDHVLQDWSQ